MESLFEQFQGADMERLADCLVAIRQAGLRTTKYTQAGLNPNSGNVWVWDEDWAGCVYCSIGFDVQWCYSCPECGEEHDFDTFREMQDYANRYEGSCKACKPRFVAGWNMPGYLPDSEPAEFDNSDEALEYIKDAAKQCVEGEAPEFASQDAMNQWCDSQDAKIEEWQTDKNGEFGHTFGRYHYFVTVEA